MFKQIKKNIHTLNTIRKFNKTASDTSRRIHINGDPYHIKAKDFNELLKKGILKPMVRDEKSKYFQRYFSKGPDQSDVIDLLERIIGLLEVKNEDKDD